MGTATVIMVVCENNARHGGRGGHPKKAWMRMRTGHGLKGDRHYDWALIDVIEDDVPDYEATRAA